MGAMSGLASRESRSRALRSSGLGGPAGRTWRCAMTATMAVTTAESTVEEVMGKIIAELGGSLGVLLNALGTRAGLWAAMAGAGPLTTTDVAYRTNLSGPLVREWRRAQGAGGYLSYDPARETFTLPQAVAVAMLHAPGGAMID